MLFLVELFPKANHSPLDLGSPRQNFVHSVNIFGRGSPVLLVTVNVLWMIDNLSM